MPKSRVALSKRRKSTPKANIRRFAAIKRRKAESNRQSQRDVVPDGSLDLSAKPALEPRAAPPPVVVPVPLGLNLPLSLSAIPLIGSSPSPSGSAGSPLPTPSVTLSPVPATAAVAPVAAPLMAPPTIEPGTMEPPASRSLLNPRVMRELDDRYPRRSLRPRQEARNYQESPDVIVLSDEEPKINGYTNGYESDSSDLGEMPPLHPIKELSPAEVEERERTLRKLREELRNEEMKLVLLKKLRQSQQMKENIAVPPTSGSAQQASSNSGSSSNLTTSSSSAKNALSSSSGKPSSAALGSHGSGSASADRVQQQPHVAHQQLPQTLIRGHHNKPSSTIQQSLMRGPPSVRGQNLPPPLLSQHARSTTTPQLPPNTTLTPTNMARSANNAMRNLGNVPFVNNRDRSKDSHQSSVATQGTPTAQERVRMDDNQTPAQRQAAAKLALRKQLEETLLQIPPPKPPPPEMHFIPNPSNTEFIYLLGLEHVVDFITKDHKTPPPPEPFKCSQCQTNFTPVWKWEKSPSKGKDPKVICESCVTTNVKKALKAEHTNRLKTAFVKALQQEQEIEQRLAQASSAPSPQPEPASVTLHPPAAAPSPAPKPATPTRHNPTPPAPPPASAPPARTPPLSARDHTLAKLASSDPNKFGGHLHGAAAAAAVALHHQLLRGSTGGGVSGLPQHNIAPHLLQFSPLIYQYQLAMAQATGGKGSVAAAAAANLAEFQRQAETIQRQYLMDMIPPHPGAQNPSASARSHNHGHHNSMNNWKT